MNAETSSREEEILNDLKAKYQKQGFEFILQPAPSDLPVFFKGIRPDALARKGSEEVVIEVKSRKNSLSKTIAIDFFSKEIPKHRGWRFELVLVDESQAGADRDAEPNLIDMKRELERITSLYDQKDLKLALVLAWALLEACARKLSFTNSKNEPKRYMPRTVVEALVSDGFITDEQAQVLTTLAVSRNRLVHGFTNIEVGDFELHRLIELLQQLVDEAQS
jgi:uncharacterized protein YutE (UPF0331/DUF86 family)